MVRGVRIKDHWSEQRLFETRAVVAGFIIVFLTFVLIARLFVLQVLRYEQYTELSQGNRVRVEPIPAARGLILDREGVVLAGNQPAYQLELVREQVANLDETLKKLASINLIDVNDIDDLRRTVLSRRVFDSVPIRLRMSEEDIARFAVRSFEFPGVEIKTRQTRWYPHTEIAVHALGYVAAISEQDLHRIDRAAYSGTTLIGKLGVEAAFEKELHGTNGFRQILVNASGRSVVKVGSLEADLKEKSPIAGQDLLLSIDLRTQTAAEVALGDQRGAVVALDPATGDVIALVSRPGFDPNMFGRGLTHAEFNGLNSSIDRPLLNRALRGAYPPGSTVKPIVALAGLALGAITPEQTRYCRGFFTLPGSSHRYRDWKPRGHGTVDMVHAIAQSCDVYFYGLADNIGIDKLSDFLGHFGFGKTTGIDISGEKPGLLPSKDWKRKAFSRPADRVWFPGETVILGIGQGFLTVTPMQLAHAAAMIASQGKSWKPRIVTGLRNPQTGQIRKVPSVELEHLKIATPEQWQKAIDGMIAVTHGGTGSASQRGALYSFAGKTGTAQVFTVKQTEKYDEKNISDRLWDHGWFIAFAPSEAPRIAIAAFIENGKHGTAAAVVARKVMDAYLLDAEGKMKVPVGTAP